MSIEHSRNAKKELQIEPFYSHTFLQAFCGRSWFIHADSKHLCKHEYLFSVRSVCGFEMPQRNCLLLSKQFRVELDTSIEKLSLKINCTEKAKAPIRLELILYLLFDILNSIWKLICFRSFVNTQWSIKDMHWWILCLCKLRRITSNMLLLCCWLKLSFRLL